MGMIICPTHGMTGIAISIEVSIVDQMLRDQAIAPHDVTLLTVNYHDEGAPALIWHYLVYKATVATHGLAMHYDIYTDDEDNTILGPLHALTSRGAICAKCFHEYKTRHGWPPDITPGIHWMAS